MFKFFTSTVTIISFYQASALACPNFSGTYKDVDMNDIVVMEQTGCEHLKMSIAKNNFVYEMNLDGKDYVAVQDESGTYIKKHVWSGDKILRSVKIVNPRNVVSFKAEVDIVQRPDGDFTMTSYRLNNDTNERTYNIGFSEFLKLK